MNNINQKETKVIKLNELEMKIFSWLNELPQVAELEFKIAKENPEIYEKVLKPVVKFLNESREIVQRKIKKELEKQI